jgi:hypothetical protein
MLLQRRIERYTGSVGVTSEDVPVVETSLDAALELDELEFEDGRSHELLLAEPTPTDAQDVVLDEPLSPELVLVLPPQLAELAREQLPEPEPLDEWLARMRRQDAHREWQAFVAAVQAREHEKAHGGIGGFVFAALMVVLSVVPAVVSLLI